MGRFSLRNETFDHDYTKKHMLKHHPKMVAEGKTPGVFPVKESDQPTLSSFFSPSSSKSDQPSTSKESQEEFHEPQPCSFSHCHAFLVNVTFCHIPTYHAMHYNYYVSICHVSITLILRPDTKCHVTTCHTAGRFLQLIGSEYSTECPQFICHLWY